LCQEAFPNDTVPNKTIIYGIITKFEETGSVCDRTHNGRHAVLNDATLQDVGRSPLQQMDIQVSAHKAVHLLYLRAYHTHAMNELISKGL
jgi:hypothetical protein